jgi:hypothetical protein
MGLGFFIFMIYNPVIRWPLHKFPKNFKFKPIFLISSHGVGPSTSTESLPSGSTNDDRGKKVVYDSAPNNTKKKKRKMYEGTCKL